MEKVNIYHFFSKEHLIISEKPKHGYI